MKVYKELANAWNNRGENCVTVFNEGGSRSAKTIDTFLFLIDLCLVSSVPLLIYVFRDTLELCREKTYQDDFLLAANLRSEFLAGTMVISQENQKPTVRIGKCTIRFRGLDKTDKKEGFPSDIMFFNELLSGVGKEQFDSVTMRCARLIIVTGKQIGRAHV